MVFENKTYDMIIHTKFFTKYRPQKAFYLYLLAYLVEYVVMLVLVLLCTWYVLLLTIKIGIFA